MALRQQSGAGLCRPAHQWQFSICYGMNLDETPIELLIFKIMNIKRIFGSVLTVLGIIGLIYGAVLFMNTHGGNRDIKALVVYGILGLLFFVSGLGLIRATKDEA
jgi:uncharacterized membrane protein